MTDNAIIFTKESLSNHDSNLLDKVADILKSKPYWDEEHNYQSIPIGYIDEVIEAMKAEGNQ